MDPKFINQRERDKEIKPDRRGERNGDTGPGKRRIKRSSMGMAYQGVGKGGKRKGEKKIWARDAQQTHRGRQRNGILPALCVQQESWLVKKVRKERGMSIKVCPNKEKGAAAKDGNNCVPWGPGGIEEKARGEKIVSPGAGIRQFGSCCENFNFGEKRLRNRAGYFLKGRPNNKDRRERRGGKPWKKTNFRL